MEIKTENIKFEVEPKPEIEDLKEVIPNTEEFNEPDKAEAIIKNLNLTIGDTLKEDGEEYIINPRMVLNGNSPQHYKLTIENLKKILTKEEIKLIDDYIKRKKENEKVRDKIYYAIEKRTDKFYWRRNIKKSIAIEIKKVLEWFKEEDHTGINNTIYHLLSKDKDDYIYCYKCAWQNKPIPNIQEWKTEDDGSYKVLTDGEADQEVDDYLYDGDLWKMAVESGNITEGFDDWCESVKSQDGRGSILNHYDGCEEEEEVNGVTYYIYRTN